MISVPVIRCNSEYKDISMPRIDTTVLVVFESCRVTKPRVIRRWKMDEINAMSLEESRRSQRPYRYGMVLLCVGALINWLGLAENYVEPVRYVGVACIIAGALLICAAMCCWLHAPPSRATMHTQHTNHPITAQIDDPIHVISIEEPSSGYRQKPPDYEAVTDAPPSYDDAIKLNPSHLVRLSNASALSLPAVHNMVPRTVEIVSRDPTPSPPPPYAR